MTIERLTKADLLTINDLRPNDWNDLVEIHRFYLCNSFCYPMKIVIDSRIVGIGTAICHGETAWLAHCIISETHRSKGIGSFLVSSLISLLKKQLSCKTISLIASDFGYPLYKKYGFKTQAEYVTLSTENDTKSSITPSNSMSNLSSEHISQVLQLDKRISGEDRNQTLRQFFHTAYVYIIDNIVVGAYFINLGEGLIISEDETSGIEFLKMCIQNKNRITLPYDNVVARSFLEGNGFNELNRIRRMVLGNPFEWNPKGIYNRIGGYLG